MQIRERSSMCEMLFAGVMGAALAMTAAYAGESAQTTIEHKPIDSAVAGQRIGVNARVSDPAGVETVRTYFRARDGAHFSFITMQESAEQGSTGNEYQGMLPAPGNGAEWIDYLILAKNGSDQVVKSQTFRMQVLDSEQAATYAEPVRVQTELARAPETVTGFDDNIIVDVVESAVKYGVVAGLTDPVSAGTEAGVAGGGAADSGTIAASTGGLKTGAVLGGLALAGGAALAGGGGGGGGSSSDNPMAGTWSGRATDYHRYGVCSANIRLRLKSDGSGSLRSSNHSGVCYPGHKSSRSGSWSIQGSSIVLREIIYGYTVRIPANPRELRINFSYGSGRFSAFVVKQ